MKDIPHSKIMCDQFLWMRTNTIELFDIAQRAAVLDYKPAYKLENATENHNLLYQFQCILTSANTHFRKIKKSNNVKFGVYVTDKTQILKQQIMQKDIATFLPAQIAEATKICSAYSDELDRLLPAFITLFQHEALHQGQLVTMFREIGIEFPKEFKEAWNL